MSSGKIKKVLKVFGIINLIVSIVISILLATSMHEDGAFLVVPAGICFGFLLMCFSFGAGNVISDVEAIRIKLCGDEIKYPKEISKNNRTQKDAIIKSISKDIEDDIDMDDDVFYRHR